jgi:uncharacterized protein (DUF2252 family)
MINLTARASVAERQQQGRAARARISRSGHADWTPHPSRRDPIRILSGQNQQRLPWLVPIRHARMGVSAFTFYRGAAAIMAEDLSGSPDSGLWVQAGGDAHLSNFGAYASPNRELVFDQNDFDETLPGPWEWDLKRLSTSLLVAGQHLGFPDSVNRAIAARSVKAYRRAMQIYAQMPTLDLWYDYLDVEDVMNFAGVSKKELKKRLARFEAKARSRTNLQALQKLTTTESGSLKIRSQPPLLVPLAEVPSEYDEGERQDAVHEAFHRYLDTTQDHIQLLLSRFQIVDVAIKVVGVGSVGTRCWIVLLEGRDNQDPLFLQIKEAVPSVLEDHLRPSEYPHQGQRVVEGQRLVQAQTDIFLGWTTGPDGNNFYVRQLRDWKGSVNLEAATPEQMHFYANVCAKTLARGHARSGDAVAISAYVGKSSTLDDAIAEFSVRYALQNQADYAVFQQAVASGQLAVADELV